MGEIEKRKLGNTEKQLQAKEKQLQDNTQRLVIQNDALLERLKHASEEETNLRARKKDFLARTAEFQARSESVLARESQLEIEKRKLGNTEKQLQTKEKQLQYNTQRLVIQNDALLERRKHEILQSNAVRQAQLDRDLKNKSETRKDLSGVFVFIAGVLIPFCLHGAKNSLYEAHERRPVSMEALCYVRDTYDYTHHRACLKRHGLVPSKK